MRRCNTSRRRMIESARRFRRLLPSPEFARSVAASFFRDTSDGSGDEDGDGRSDADEFLAGTDPDDASSNTAFTVEVMSDGSKMARWNGALDRVYDILWSDDLDSFEEFVVGMPGTDAVQQRLDEAHDADPAGFYRLRTRYPTGGRD